MKSNNLKNKVSSKKRTGFIKIFTLLCFSFLSLTLIFSGFNFITRNIEYSSAESSTELTQEIQDYIINNGYYKSRNLFDNSSVVYSVLNDGSLTKTETGFIAYNPITNGSSVVVYWLQNLKSNITYTISFKLKFVTNTTGHYPVFRLNRNVVLSCVSYNEFKQFSYTFTPDIDGDYRLEFVCSNSQAGALSSDITYVENIQLEEGPIATPYRPYEETIEEYKQNNAINLSWSYQDDYLNRFQVSDSYPSVSIPLPNNYLSINNITFVLRGFYSSGQILYDKTYNYSLSFDDLPFLLLGYQDYEYCRLSIVDNSLLFEDLGSGSYFSYIENLVIDYSTLGYSQEEFDENYSNGYELGNNEGYSTGYDEGYSTGKSNGYELGKTDALNGKTTFRDLVYSIIDAPFNVISSAFNFDIFGINIASFLMLIVSLLLVAFVLRRLL